MTTMDSAGIFNAEATLNAWLVAALAALTRPAWLPAMPAMILTQPETIAVLPAFSVHHTPVNTYDLWQGRAVGDGKRGVRYVANMEVNAWASRSNRNWQAQLRTMQDMVATVYTKTKGVEIKNYATNQSSPTETGYLIRLVQLTGVSTAPDPNPDIVRARMLIRYAFVYRSQE